MESKYKVGDIVKIKKLLVDGDYRHGANSEMVEQAGKTFKIMSVSPSTSPACTIPDDGFVYKLDGIGWSWASSMFEDLCEIISELITEKE